MYCQSLKPFNNLKITKGSLHPETNNSYLCLFKYSKKQYLLIK
ncbi:hypothetical protein HMPREF2141_00568 [Bacteroides uniformis]|uniref:Uncharacterized protein n=1 Tax=Bacteroides uniformis str. 3978 T3 ii TaxID=1339349 RepID=A0A078S167_BACUN|nr:hypothetical protein M094_2109 [Bacteroides uniformis str. 3978 T3 ii]KDS61501.1 hypothetical protein M093_2582 [Bacteroides uniformis str. 3978 T3 i]KXT38454.1 hypothetical protein HMPREF2141_00568 [Bacteroides uniformis]